MHESDQVFVNIITNKHVTALAQYNRHYIYTIQTKNVPQLNDVIIANKGRFFFYVTIIRH